MKIYFNKLSTKDNKVKISFDKGISYQEYDNNICLTQGISFTMDDCNNDLSNIYIKGKIKELSDIEYVKHISDVSSKVHLYAFSHDGYGTFYTTILPTPENLQKNQIWLNKINDEGYLVSADCYDWPSWVIWDCQYVNDNQMIIDCGDETPMERNSSLDLDIDKDKILNFLTYPLYGSNSDIEGGCLPKGVRFTLDGRGFISDGESSVSDYRKYLSDGVCGIMFNGYYDGIYVYQAYRG